MRHDAAVSSTSAPSLRLFLALWPGRATLDALRAWQGRWAWPHAAAVVAPERLHLTLHFIGPVPAGRLPELVHGLAVASPCFELRLGRAQLWRGNLAVLRADAVPAGLATLHAQLQASLRRLALPLQAQPLVPHVTLARRATGAEAPRDPLALRWPVRRYALVQSLGGYKTLVHYPLG